MTKRTWNFAQRATALATSTSMFATSFWAIGSPASATSISTLKAEAQTIAAKIQLLGRREDGLAQQYDQAHLAARQAALQVRQAASKASAAAAKVNSARSILQKEAIDSYVNGGVSVLVSAASVPLANANESLLRAEYVSSLASNQAQAMDRYHFASLQYEQADAALKKQETADQATLVRLSAARQAVISTQSSLEAVYRQDTGHIAVLVARAQAAAAAAAARREQARLAAQRAAQQAAAAAAARQAAAAAAAASARRVAAAAAARQAALAAQHRAAALVAAPAAAPTVTAPAPSSTTTAPPSYQAPPAAPPAGPSSAAAMAVAAAKTRLGDPYVWGAAGPNAFDCSGLVMWAYAQAGISLPHYSGAQYADTTHIPMSDLQPGDLVFPANPGQHVAMYIGGGEIIQAPYTGATVQIVPLSSWFVLASQVA